MEEFGRWDEESLKNLCACLKPTFYVEHTHIIRENDPVDRMIFVVQGKLWTYSSSPKDDSTNDSSAKGTTPNLTMKLSLSVLITIKLPRTKEIKNLYVRFYSIVLRGRTCGSALDESVYINPPSLRKKYSSCYRRWCLCSYGIWLEKVIDRAWPHPNRCPGSGRRKQQRNTPTVMQ